MRGLKFRQAGYLVTRTLVAPYTGAWIEITNGAGLQQQSMCRTLHGAWIEIFRLLVRDRQTSSHPTRVRGLKFSQRFRLSPIMCRTLHGCVDYRVIL